MGFFDRFRKRVQEVADETDLDELTAEEGTEEAVEALTTTDPEPPQEVFESPEEIAPEPEPTDSEEIDDDWDAWAVAALAKPWPWKNK